MNTNVINNPIELNQDIINFVIAHLKTIPSNVNISVGGDREPMSVDAVA